MLIPKIAMLSKTGEVSSTTCAKAHGLSWLRTISKTARVAVMKLKIWGFFSEILE